MKSAPRGDDTSQVEALGISPHGIWLFLGYREAFLPFADFPWFVSGTVAQIRNIVREGASILHWPDLDVDLDLERIRHPERFPLHHLNKSTVELRSVPCSVNYQ